MSENTVERNGKPYKVIDPDTYIEECEWNCKGGKNGYIITREAKEGKHVDADGRNGAVPNQLPGRHFNRQRHEV